MRRKSLRARLRDARNRTETEAGGTEYEFVQPRYRRRRRVHTNRHHFFRARSRGGSMARQNLLIIDIERHANWHKVFGNMGAEEVLALLTRVCRAKRSQK